MNEQAMVLATASVMTGHSVARHGCVVVKSRPTNFTDLTIHCKMIIKSDSHNFYLFFQCSSGVGDVDHCDVHISVSSLPGAKKNAVSFVRIEDQTV